MKNGKKENNKNKTNKNKKNNLPKVFHSEMLEQDTNILIKYILFNKELHDSINISNISPFYKRFTNCYLTNITLWYKYKSYFFYQTLNTIAYKEVENSKPFNNHPKNSEEYLINKIYNSLVKFYFTHSDLYNKEQSNIILSDLKIQNKFEIIYENHIYNDILTKYPSNFAIIDEYVYKDLIKRFGTLNKNNYLNCEIIINEGKIIIKCDSNEKEENNYYVLLIGNLGKDNIFELLYLINFIEEKNRQEFFESFLENNFMEIMEKHKTYFTFENFSQTQQFIYFNDIKKNFNDNYIGDSIIKIFLFLYLVQEDIELKMKDTIKNNGTQFYYIINKQWMKIYKDYYNYEELYTYFEDMKKNKLFNYNYKQLMTCIETKNYEKSDEFMFQLIKNIPCEILQNLESKKKNQKKLLEKLNNNLFFTEKIKYENEISFKYIGENEVFNLEFFDLFNKLETKSIKESLKLQIEKIECLIGENQFFIKSEESDTNNSIINYHLLNIGYIKNNIFSPSSLILFFEKSDLYKIISNLNKYSFSNFIQWYNLIENSFCDIKNSEDKIIGKIYRVNPLSEEIKNIIENPIIFNSDSMNLLKLIIYFKIFNKEIKNPTTDNQEQKVYFVKTDFIEQIQKFENYKTINDFIINKKEIEDIINNNYNKSFKELSELVMRQFDIKTIEKINEDKNDIDINITSFNVNLEKITINQNVEINYANNFIFLPNEIYNLFKGWTFWNENYSCKYLIQENKIFMIDKEQNSIFVYNIKAKNELSLELIQYFDIYKELVINQIKENGFNKFKEYNLFNNKIVSPIFDKNEEKIGYFYKYSSSIKEYDNNNINTSFEMRKLILLVLNYLNIQEQNNKNISFTEYYIVNKNWINNYKLYYNFDSILKEMLKNPEIKDLMNDLKLNEKNDKFISDKKVFNILTKLPENIINNFIEREKNFDEKYVNTETKVPQILSLEYFYQKEKPNTLFYYADFEIIDSKIYEYLFNEIDTDINIGTKFFLLKETIKNEAEKVLCFFDKNRIVIKLLENNLFSDKKCVLYIGKINTIFIFEIECFLIYNTNSLMDEHIQIILSSMGFNTFVEQFTNSKINIKELKIGNKKYGLAIKKNQIKEYDLNIGDNDLISKYFTFPPKVRLDKIKNNLWYMNSILQCFCQIEEFVSYFKYHSHVNKVINDLTKEQKLFLSISFKILIEKLWPEEGNSKESSKGHFSPVEFIQKIEDMSPIFINNKSYNAKDFINFIITTLHEELNQKIKGNNIINPLNNNDNNNLINTFQAFHEEYQRNFRSKISELFYAIQQTDIQCLDCRSVHYNFQAYFFLVFPLEEVKLNSINKINPNNKINKDLPKEKSIKFDKLNKNIVDIFDCFEFFQRRILLEANDQIFCNFCKKMTNVSHTSTLITSPKILILIFDRGEKFQHKIKLEFYLILKLGKYVQQNNQNLEYKLISIVSYLKQNYCIAYCLSPIDNQWYNYNDANVNKIDDFQKEINNIEFPYLLFYKRIE